MDRYGLPYQGSKNKIAPWVIEYMPKAHTLVDLFAGGCAVTHCALLSDKYEEVIANDFTDSVELFRDALEGSLEKYEPDRFRTREDFFAEKDNNPFVRIIYSFGNNQRTYLYGRNIEPYKKAVHEMLYAPTVNERRLKFKAVIREMEKLGLLSNNYKLPPPLFLKDNQVEWAKQRIGSVNMSVWKTMSGQGKSKE